ncbi:hypothetical protein KJY77_03175 [Canibacter sp. lx-72]|uniref:hypothetical protein n=1 Tax=Canibacter zhuwentaonis TaxID=2837491 RepID=UPI001BDCA7B8|nr:hypothetical protein [Canibacter zhuwentaonis]MBT1018140.1 hypothetical protein [Canibacter zhuwentaonis]MBT1035325.1 hypothetical protein [Canibacter zhuwentaonis]
MSKISKILLGVAVLFLLAGGVFGLLWSRHVVSDITGFANTVSLVLLGVGCAVAAVLLRKR